MASVDGRRRRQSPMTSILLLFVAVLLLLPPLSTAFECFTGDKDILRRKQCPTFGSVAFSDVCFKRIDGPVVQRGCFNSLIASLITESDSIPKQSCLPIPRKYGTGTICLCETELCNAARPAAATASPALLLLAVAAALALSSVALARP